MRILAAHDAAGNIHEVVLSPADAPPATVTPEPGLLLTEVEAPEGIRLDLSDPDRSRGQLEKFSRQLQELRVEVGKAELVRKKKKKN
jgi:hypothetical protein